MPVPPTRVQQQIADYLDHETAEIDTLVRGLQQMLGLLSERLDASWTSSFQVLQQTHPSIKIRHLVDSLVDGPFGSSLTSAHYSEQGAAVVRLGNIRRAQFILEPRVYIPLKYSTKLFSHNVKPGDVVIAGLGDDHHPLGRSAVVPEAFGVGIVKADCYRARPNSLVHPEYLAWALSSRPMSDIFQEESRGSTRARLNLGIVSQTSIPVPELFIQETVINDFNKTAKRTGEVLDEIESAIDLARERRAALITAAVTGQIDVTARNKPAAEQLEDDIAQGLHREYV